MTSAAQLAANQENAQRSTGPKTEEGKRRASLNATRHGLTSQVSAMTQEDQAAHDQFCDGILKSLAPEGAVEFQLAQRVATDSWRLNRIAAIEDNLFAIGLTVHGGYDDRFAAEHPAVEAAFAAARTFEAQAKNLQLLSLYEQRLNRAVQKNLATLRELQAERKVERERALQEAAKLHQVNETKGLPYDPAKDGKNGFVFSIDEIRATIDRRRRLERAEHRDLRRQKHPKSHVQAVPPMGVAA